MAAEMPTSGSLGKLDLSLRQANQTPTCEKYALGSSRSRMRTALTKKSAPSQFAAAGVHVQAPALSAERS